MVFSKLTVKSLRRKLILKVNSEAHAEERDHIGALIPFGVETNGLEREPVGLLLSEIVYSGNRENQEISLEILSLVVRNPWRGQGIARKLLDSAISWGRKKNLKRIEISIPLGTRYTAALEHLTNSDNGWNDSPGLTLVHTEFNAHVMGKMRGFLLRLKRISHRYQKRCGWEIRAFTSQDVEALQAVSLNIDLPNWANPAFIDLNTIAYKYSRLLKIDDQIIGWLLCDFINSDLLRYTRMWVDPECDSRGGSMAMLEDVISSAHFKRTNHHDLDQISGKPYLRACFGFEDVGSSPMSRMCHKNFLDISEWTRLRNRNLILAHDQY